MRVVLVNHSDSKGGASVATYRLYEALRGLGVDVRMLVMHRTIEDKNIGLLQPYIRRKACFLYEHAEIFVRNGFDKRDLFKTSIAVCGMPIHRHPWVEAADVVVLEWINQGMLSLKEISRIKAPVAWIMHDMWCITGVCHHAHDCDRYKINCGHCPLVLAGRREYDMSRETWFRKKMLYASKRINFVSVSTWLSEKCKESSLMKGQIIRQITNPIEIRKIRTEPIFGRDTYNLPPKCKLLIMGAARLDDPIKGLDIAVKALNRLVGMDIAVVFFGEIRDPHALDGLRVPYVHVGMVTDAEVLNDLYAHATVVLSTSHYESLGLTLIEGMATGCVPVTFGTGGQTDIVEHKKTGYIASYPSDEDIAAGIKYALSGILSKDNIRQYVINKFDSANVARQYIKLFETMI